MPQVADLLKLSPQGGAPASRKQLITESHSKKFDDVLKNQSIKSRKSSPVEKSESPKKPEPSEDDPVADESEKDSKKAEASKTSKKESASKNKSARKTDDQPTDEVETNSVAEQKKSNDKPEDSEDQPQDMAGPIKPEDAAATEEITDDQTDSVELTAQLAMASGQAVTQDSEASIDAGSEQSVDVAVKSLKAEPAVSGNVDAGKAIKPDNKPAPLELPAEAATEEKDESTEQFEITSKGLHGSQSNQLDKPQVGQTQSNDPAVDLLQAIDSSASQKTQSAQQQHPVAHVQQASAPERDFADKNVDRIVTTMNGNLSTNGGTMKIRLDPPNLGELHVDVTVDRDGTLTASFQTSNDEATRLLSHNLQNLKSSLEATGVTVDKIQVKQAAPSEQSSSQNQNDSDRQQQNANDHPARQEQQRREILEKMWRKMVYGEEPLDLVA